MLSADSIEQTILELEAKDTTFANCERLAPLYIVLDHIKGYQKPKTVKEGKPLDVKGDSEFLKAINGRNSVGIWQIMDELMQVIQATRPKLYNKVIDDIKKL